MTDSPFEDPVPRGLGVLQATLRITAAVVCWGWAARQLHLNLDSPLAGLLQSWVQLNEAQTGSIERVAAYVFIGVGALTLLRPCWMILFPGFLWLSLITVGIGFQPGNDRVWSALEHAPGAVVLLALILVDFWPPKLRFSLGMLGSGLWLIRLSVSLAFASQGIQAILASHQGGDWIPLLQQALEKLLARPLTEQDARLTLAFFGSIDLAIGLTLLVRRSRLAALLATLWGVAAAGVFTLAAGETNYPETLIRAGLIGGPATLFWFWCLAVQEEPPSIVAKRDF